MAEASLIRVSLKNHSPQEIYKYLTQKFGRLGMKVKAKQAIIGFEDRQVFKKVVEVSVVNILGKRLELKAITKQQQDNPGQIDEDQLVQHVDKQPESKSGAYFPDFRTSNPVEEVINSCKVSMMEHIQKQFGQIIQQGQNKVVQITSKVNEEEPRRRQIQALKVAIANKLRTINGKYQKDIIKVNDSIQRFSVSGDIRVIDVEPKFAVDNQIPLSRISVDNIGLTSFRSYTNLQQFPCKRLCALNRDEFIVTTSFNTTTGRKGGKVKIFDVNQNECKASYDCQQGAYGIARCDKMILVGTYQNSILTVNLQSEQIIPQNAILPGSLVHLPFFEIKTFQKQGQTMLAAILGLDKSIRFIQICKQEVLQGLFTTSIEQVKKYDLPSDAMAIEVHKGNILLVAMQDKIYRYDIQKKSPIFYQSKSKVLKIKKFNQNIYALGTQNGVRLLDVRAESIVQTFSELKSEVRALQILPPHTLVYGSQKQIGMLDDRKSKYLPWKNDTFHKNFISDILRLGDKVISCDKGGEIVSWKIEGLIKQSKT